MSIKRFHITKKKTKVALGGSSMLLVFGLLVCLLISKNKKVEEPLATIPPLYNISQAITYVTLPPITTTPPPKQPGVTTVPSIVPTSLPLEEQLQIEVSSMPNISCATVMAPFTYEMYRHLTKSTIADAENTIHSTTSRDAYNSLALGESDLILVSSPNEAFYASQTDILLQPIAYDALLFYVHPDNPVSDISTEDLLNIYQNTTTNWENVGGSNLSITPYRSNEYSPSYELLSRYLLKGTLLPDTTSSLSLIENYESYSNYTLYPKYDKNKEGIGYTTLYAYLSGTSLTTRKLLSIDSVPATIDTIQSETYPYTSKYYVAIRRNTSITSPTYQLYQWLTGKTAQSLVAKAGYIPIDSSIKTTVSIKNEIQSPALTQVAKRKSPLFPNQNLVLSLRDGNTYSFNSSGKGIHFLLNTLASPDTLTTAVTLVSPNEAIPLLATNLDDSKNSSLWGFYNSTTNTWVVEPSYSFIYNVDYLDIYSKSGDTLFYEGHDATSNNTTLFNRFGKRVLEYISRPYIYGSTIYYLSDSDILYNDSETFEVKKLPSFEFPPSYSSQTLDDYDIVSITKNTFLLRRSNDYYVFDQSGNLLLDQEQFLSKNHLQADRLSEFNISEAIPEEDLYLVNYGQTYYLVDKSGVSLFSIEYNNPTNVEYSAFFHKDKFYSHDATGFSEIDPFTNKMIYYKYPEELVTLMSTTNNPPTDGHPSLSIYTYNLGHGYLQLTLYDYSSPDSEYTYLYKDGALLTTEAISYTHSSNNYFYYYLDNTLYIQNLIEDSNWHKEVKHISPEETLLGVYDSYFISEKNHIIYFKGYDNTVYYKFYDISSYDY